MAKPIGKFVFKSPGKDAVECAALWPNEGKNGETYYSLQVHTERKTGEWPTMPFARALELASETGPDGKKRGYINFWVSGPRGSVLTVSAPDEGGVAEDDYADI